jgi:ketosteroid isomerase-like protein
MSNTPHASITEEEVSGLFRRAAEANEALINADIGGYLRLIKHSDDFTLMSPFGGTPTRGFEPTAERVAALARFFKSGRSELELVQAYACADMVVLVIIERQQIAVADLPEQDWSLRVTLVYRRAADGWQLAHRHADPLARGITVEQAAAIARGDDPLPEAAR